MSRNWHPLSAAILAGGQSRRMGRNKALLPLVEGGPAMIEIVLGRLRSVADEVTIVANDREQYALFGARIVPDLLPGAGTLAGIHAALSAARNEHCLIVACDMPFLNTALLAVMSARPRDYDVLVPLLPGESRQRADGLVYQTLHAIYSRTCIGPIERQLAGGNRQVIGFFPDVRIETLGVDEVARYDPELRSFFNANTPETLANARQLSIGRELDGEP